MDNKKTIILCGGGTAGHIMPNIALLPELKKHFENIYYVGQKNSMEEEIAMKNAIKFLPIECIKFDRKNLVKNIKIPFVLSNCVRRCKSLLLNLKPNVVFSKGGYVSLPVILACKQLNIPYCIHESDYTMGLANKIVTKSASAVFTNFSDTYTGKNAYSVGIPMRKELFSQKSTKEILTKMNLSNRKTILVVGGSSGAKNINQKVEKIIPELCKNLNVIHLTGKGKTTNLNVSGYYQSEFCDNMGDLYKASDLVVSRAGATTICELCVLNKKAILIPLTRKASRGDQIKNARHVAKYPNFSILDDDNFTENDLLKEIFSLIEKPLSKNHKNTDATQKIVQILVKVSSK